MKTNPVSNCTFIIRCQAEYSAASRTVTLRCILEMPAGGRHRSFSDMDALLAALEADLLSMQSRLVLSGREP